MQAPDKNVYERSLRCAQEWLTQPLVDEATKKELHQLLTKTTTIEGKEALVNAFYKDLRFGTGGLRGLMGIGPACMNTYTVIRATMGLAKYVQKAFSKKERITMVIAYDNRHHSNTYARLTAEVLSSEGIWVMLFEGLRTTPELSFTIRNKQCQAGVMITASHNPKTYNGYKIYWNDGAQITSPHDKEIEACIEKTPEFCSYTKRPSYIRFLGKQEDTAYFRALMRLSFHQKAIHKTQKNLHILYTPLHGTGITAVPTCLQQMGFENVHILESQQEPHGDFPNAPSPNPEEKETMSAALQEGQKKNVHLILATDPDADRVGVAIKNNQNAFVLLTGNQIGILIGYYILLTWKEYQWFTGGEYIVRSIVTTPMIDTIANDFGVPVERVYTGFKHVGALIQKQHVDEKKFLFGFEESYGYLVGDFVRDKDGVGASCVLSSMLAWSHQKGISLYELLMQAYDKYGLYHDRLYAITLEGEKGHRRIQDAMITLRKHMPQAIGGINVKTHLDYSAPEHHQKLGPSNVIQLLLEDDTLLTVRPSGTEPKIKFYLSVRDTFSKTQQHTDPYEKVVQKLDTKMDTLLNDLKKIQGLI